MHNLTLKKGKCMGTETEELLLKKMDALLEAFENQEIKINKKLKEYEKNSTELFATLLLQFSSDVASDFKRLLDNASNDNVSNEELKQSIIDLRETVNSKAVEQAATLFSDRQLTQLRLDVVKPILDATDKSLNTLNDNVLSTHKSTAADLQTLHDSVIGKLREVENNLMSEHKTTQSRVEAIKGQRRFS